MNEEPKSPDFDHVFQSMRRRIPWNVARIIFNETGIETGLGWEKTRSKISAEDIGKDRLGELIDRLHQHNLCGEKFTKLYKLSESEHEQTVKKLLDLAPSDSPFAKAYPLSLPVSDFPEDAHTPRLVSVTKDDDGVGIVFSAVIDIVTRVPIVISEAIAAASPLMNSYDEIIGLKREKRQVFNAIRASHHHRYLEVRNDIPQGVTSDLAHGMHSAMRSVLNDLTDLSIETPVDLAELIERMYDDEGEGIVVELGFVTTTGSVKNEKMRRQGLDLRQEIYHKSGKAGLPTKIEPFRLSLRWLIDRSKKLRSQPELGLIGTSRGRHKLNGEAVSVTGAMVRGAADQSDYEFVAEKMLAKLNAPESQDATLQA